MSAPAEARKRPVDTERIDGLLERVEVALRAEVGWWSSPELRAALTATIAARAVCREPAEWTGGPVR